MRKPLRSFLSIFGLLSLLFAGLPSAPAEARSSLPAAAVVASASNVVYNWAKGMGGTSYDRGRAIAVDGIGNVYTTGDFSSGTADFDPGAGVYNLTSAGAGDIFISKLDEDGNFAWAKGMGGTDTDWGRAIAVT